MIVRVPASSANLGPGFDALGMALTLHAEVGLLGRDGTDASTGEGLMEGARALDQHHPATIAFRACGGSGHLWARCPIPSGRGLGFSGAVRVAGAVLAHALRAEPHDDPHAEPCDDPHDDRADHPHAWLAGRDEILRVVSELEGHADNAAASLFGGVVATAAGRVVRVPLALGPTVVVWVPTSTTATDESRRVLRDGVPLADAVFNVGRTALLVAALAAGDVDALRDACADRLHQAARLARAPASSTAIAAALDAGAWGAWLSGSGPTVAAWCAPDDVDRLVAALPPEGHTKLLRIDHRGAVVRHP